jgi:amino acid transporter
MANRIESSYSLPPGVKRAAGAFRLFGWVSFWAQVVLGVISTIMLPFAAGSLGGTPAPGTNQATPNPAAGAGLMFAILGLIALYAGAFWAFRYTRLARKLKTSDPKVRPKKGDATQALRIGLLINLVGMLLTIIGAQAIVGALVVKSMAQGFAFFAGNITQIVRPLDVFVVQANTNTIMAHFIGIVISLWLIQVMSRQ